MMNTIIVADMQWEQFYSIMVFRCVCVCACVSTRRLSCDCINIESNGCVNWAPSGLWYYLFCGSLFLVWIFRSYFSNCDWTTLKQKCRDSNWIYEVYYVYKPTPHWYDIQISKMERISLCAPFRNCSIIMLFYLNYIFVRKSSVFFLFICIDIHNIDSHTFRSLLWLMSRFYRFISI